MENGHKKIKNLKNLDSSMVVMRREPYTKLDESIEDALDVADKWLRILQSDILMERYLQS